MDINLGAFLKYLGENFPVMTYLSTNNQSFPENARFSKMFIWELESSLPNELLNRNIKSVNASKSILHSILRGNFDMNIRPIYLAIEIY